MAPDPTNDYPGSQEPASAAPPSSKGIRALEDKDAEGFFPGVNDTDPWGATTYDQQAEAKS